MKKRISLFLLLLACPLMLMAGEFVLYLKSGGTVGYALSTKPKLTFNGQAFTLTTTQATVTFQHQEVEKFTLEKDGYVNIDETIIGEKAEPQVRRQPGQLTFAGRQPGDPVSVYTSGGRLVLTVKADADGLAVVQTQSLPSGVYIVKSEGFTLKVAIR